MHILTRFIFGIILLLRFCKAFTSATIEPEQQVHIKGRYLTVTCSTTEFDKIPILIYHYKSNNYTIPQIKSSNQYQYIGNLTITEPDQFKVNVLCLQKYTDNLLSAKIYFFGYTPEMVLIGDATPKLNCQDFNLRRIICCLKPNENEIAQLTGLVEEQSDPITTMLYNLQSREKEIQFNKTCYNLTQEVFVQSLNLNLSITNALGSHNYTFSFERTKIMKPEAPNVFLVAVDKDVIKLEITLIDDGEFEITGFCSSNNPKNVTKNISKNITGRTKMQLPGWIPYSKVVCELRSKILFGYDPQGNFSEPGRSNLLQMPESKPNKGPVVSSALMIFYSVTFDNYLENIVLYFQDVSRYDQNGIIIFYKWKCDDCFIDKGHLSVADEILSSNSRSIKLYRAKLNSSFMITACTTKGCSDDWSIMSFQNRPVGRVIPRIYLIYRNNNKMDLLWYLDNELSRISEKHFIFICYSTGKECSSTKLIEIDNRSNGSKSFNIQGKTPKKFAFIQSLNDSNSSQLKWSECIYRITSIYEIERKLLTVTETDYISHDLNNLGNNYFSPVAKLKIKIPPCHKLDVIILDAINIIYDELTENGIQNVSYVFRHHDEIEIPIRNLRNGQTYTFNISIITADGVLVRWTSYSITTNWLTISILVIIIIAVIVVFCLFIIGVYYLFKNRSEKYFKNKYKPTLRHNTQTRNNVVRNEISQPLNLNNVDQESEDLKYERISYSISNSSSPAIQQSTSETKISETSGTSDYSNTDSKNTENDFTNHSYKERPAPNSEANKNYIDRPNNSPSDEHYIDLVMVESKTDKQMHFIPDGSVSISYKV